MEAVQRSDRGDGELTTADGDRRVGRARFGRGGGASTGGTATRGLRIATVLFVGGRRTVLAAGCRAHLGCDHLVRDRAPVGRSAAGRVRPGSWQLHERKAQDKGAETADEVQHTSILMDSEPGYSQANPDPCKRFAHEGGSHGTTRRSPPELRPTGRAADG